MLKDRTAGYVYAVRAQTGLIKLGRTRNSIEQRLNALRLYSPVPLELLGYCWTDAAADVERYFHHRFADRRVHGEWFSLTTRDLALIMAFGRGRGETEPAPQGNKRQPVFYSPLVRNGE